VKLDKTTLTTLTPLLKRGAIALAIVGLCGWAGFRLFRARATPTSEQAELPLMPVVPPVDAGASAPPAVATPVPTTATIVFTTVPAAHATVTWGKKKLGRITPSQALVVTRPRDSGPLDVIVRAEGFMVVHTRAHTFADNRVSIKLTPPDQKTVLLGYRVPIDAGVPVGSDGLPLSDAGVQPPSTSLWPF
jgi:hypothetical protein